MVVLSKILQFAKSSQPIPPQQQRSVQPPTQSFQKQQQKQNQTTENQGDRCKKRQKISNDSSNESLEPTESNDTSRNNTFGGKSDLSIDANEEMASGIEDDQANDRDEEESTSADAETQINTIIEYHSQSPNEFHSSLSNETDDTYKTEISKSYAEMHKTKKYVLTFHEFNNETSASNGLEYDVNCNLVERLELSNISLASGTNIQAEDLDAEEANKVKAWRRCTKQNNYFYPPQANSINECQLHTLLTRLNNESSHSNKNTSELEYIVENVSVLLQYIFEPRSSLYFKWEKSSYAVSDDRCKDIRLDLVLFHDDQEIGCGEIKSNCTDVKLLDEDKARIAETMKRQLHKRIISSRGLNEFKTFGFFFNGVQLELYTMTFNPESVDEHYQLFQEVDLKVPCFRDTYNNLEETLEYFKALKGIIENSLPQDPTNTPLLKQNYVTLFQPTFRFTKS